VKRGDEFGTWGYFFRAGFYISLMTFAQLYWLATGSTVLKAVLLGCASALIGLNVQHDANHGAASKKPWVNEVLGFGADMIGGSKYTWIEQHWTHHAYTNHPTKDGDAISAEPLMLFNDYKPGHPARKWFHRFQAVFFLPILSFYWLSSVFNPQILDLNQRGTAETMDWSNDYIKGRRFISVFLRLVYIAMNVVSPFYHHEPLTALYHIWIMSSVESVFLSGLFSLSHNFESVDRYPVDAYNETGEQVCWMKAQVETSSTYGSFISGYVTGGLNFQIEHHLFPRMSSAYYPYIAPKVREICAKHGVHYAWYPWIWQNFFATIKYMHNSGTGGHWAMDPLSGKD
jgi:fatty acid desaturase (delta-4 desaturase)